MKSLLATFFFIASFNWACSQPQTNNWFFCSGNGLSFSSGSPLNIPGGKIIVQEGASAISDKNGQLLFYSDGVVVWDKNHNTMPGPGLYGGGGSSTQSSVIIPKTRDGLQYYIFTTDQEGGNGGLRYSVVDMSLNSGNGAITVANIPLVAPVSEKVTAVRHCNQKDYWVITHKYGSDAYYSYLASDTGVNTTPVISHTGSFIPVAYATMAGGIKASPDGKKLVAAHGNIGIELSDFNNQTGIVSNTASIFDNDNPGIPYGVEFSSNSSLLYVSVTHYWDGVDFVRYSGVFQFDVSLPNLAAIINSKTQLIRYEQGNEMGLLQRGPDGKIYLVHYMKPYLSIVNSPNIAGLGCNFVNNGFTLSKGGFFSLPNFINNYGTEDSFSTNIPSSCVNQIVNFNYAVLGHVTSLSWNFDDPGSGSLNSSIETNPSHSFSTAGTYTVKLIKYSPCGNDTLKKQFTVGDVSVNLGSDNSFCEGSSLLLDPHSQGTNTYLWQDGSVNSTYKASMEGQYWVQVTNTNGCSRRDTIVLSVKPLPTVNLGKDTSLCPNQTILLDAKNSGAQYQWHDNSMQQTFLVNQPGKFWVAVTMNGCVASDTIIVNPIQKPVFSLGPDQYLCPPGQPIYLNPNISAVSYLWQDGSVSSTYSATHDGLYYVDLSNTCGTTRDSIYLLKSSCKVYVPNAFTPNNDGLNDIFQISGSNSIAEFEMRIYNRWGQPVFVTKNKNLGWNGKYHNIPSPSGVYVYFIRYKELNEPEKQLKGTFILIR